MYQFIKDKNFTNRNLPNVCTDELKNQIHSMADKVDKIYNFLLENNNGRKTN